jgi:indole-3-glycerol phosphate synthase
MNILQNILETKKEEIHALKKTYSISSFSGMQFFNKINFSLYDKLKNNDHISIIAEIKKSSPSKGILKNNFNHLSIAESYLKNDVDAISILTDEKFFDGNIEYLKDIAAISDRALLRKDFIIDELQIFESKAFGADVILLISEALSKNQIKDYSQIALEIGLEVLLEIHSEDQITKIDFDLNKIMGINNRDLETFNVDINNTVSIKSLLPNDQIIISESGISKRIDVELLKQNKINGILVGEHLMNSTNVDYDISQLKNWCKIEN